MAQKMRAIIKPGDGKLGFREKPIFVPDRHLGDNAVIYLNRADLIEKIILVTNGRNIDSTPLTIHELKFIIIDRAFNLVETKEDSIIKPQILFES